MEYADITPEPVTFTAKRGKTRRAVAGEVNLAIRERLQIRRVAGDEEPDIEVAVNGPEDLTYEHARNACIAHAMESALAGMWWLPDYDERHKYVEEENPFDAFGMPTEQFIFMTEGKEGAKHLRRLDVFNFGEQLDRRTIAQMAHIINNVAQYHGGDVGFTSAILIAPLDEGGMYVSHKDVVYVDSNKFTQEITEELEKEILERCHKKGKRMHKGDLTRLALGKKFGSYALAHEFGHALHANLDDKEDDNLGLGAFARNVHDGAEPTGYATNGWHEDEKKARKEEDFAESTACLLLAPHEVEGSRRDEIIRQLTVAGGRPPQTDINFYAGEARQTKRLTLLYSMGEEVVLPSITIPSLLEVTYDFVEEY